jgi:hypothetical protein
MTHRNVEALLGRLATDPTLRRRFAADPQTVIREVRAQGYDLTPIEEEALAATDADAIRRLADALDRRIRKAEPGRISEDLQTKEEEAR